MYGFGHSLEVLQFSLSLAENSASYMSLITTT